MFRIRLWCQMAALVVRRARPATAVLAAISGALFVSALVLGIGVSSYLNRADTKYDQRLFGQDDPSGCIAALLRGDHFRNGQYDRVILALSPAASCADTPPPAGLAVWPQPGQIFVSPELRRLASADAGLATRFPRIDGTIAAEGLISSNEQRVIVGGTWKEVLAYPFASRFQRFGLETPWLAGYLRANPSSFRTYVALYTVPVSISLGIAIAVLDLRTRSRQLRVMNLLGFSQRLGRLLTVSVATGYAAVGGFVGLVGASLLSRRVTPTFAGLRAFRGDYTVSFLEGLPAVGVTIALIGSGSVFATRRRKRPKRRGTAYSRLATVPLAASVVLVLSAGISLSVRSNSLLMAGGRAAAFAGTALVLGELVSQFGRWMHSARSATVASLGGRLRYPARNVLLASSVLAGGLFISSQAVGIAQAAAERPEPIAAQFATDSRSLLILRYPSTAALSAVEERSVIVGTDGDETRPNWFRGTCQTIRAAQGQDAPCDASTFYAYTNFAPDRSSLVGVPADMPLQMQSGPRAATISDGVISVAEPELDGAEPVDSVYVPVPVAEAESLMNRIIGLDPVANVRFAGAEVTAGATELNGILSAFGWGGNYASLAAGVGLLICVVALVYDRRAEARYLHVLGVSTSKLRWILVGEVMIPASVACFIAVPLAWLWSRIDALSRNAPARGFVDTAWPFGRALLIAGIAVVLFSIATLRFADLVGPIDDGELQSVDP